MKFWNRIQPLVRPVPAIEFVLAVVSIAQALYIFSPVYAYSAAANGLTPFVAALSHPALIFVYGLGLFVTGLLILYGINADNPRLRSAGVFGQYLFRFYHVVLVILTAGLLPITWVYQFTLACICVVLWAWERGEVKRNART